MKRTIIIGVDPGTGVSSPTGFVGIDSYTREILWQEKVGSKHKKLEHRIREISELIDMHLISVDQGKEPSTQVLVCIESFVMRGKGGESLQRLIGSILGRVPYGFTVVHVPNTRMKHVMGGSGRADKPEVGQGVLEWFEGENPSAVKQVKILLADREWDILDALGIAITGFELEEAE